VPTALESVAACALAAPPEDACRRVLERVRHDFDADVAVLAACDGAAGAFVDRAPAAAALEPDADLLAAAFGQGEPVALHGRESERLLAIGLDLAEAGRWCLALGRAAGAPWTRLATERREAVAVRERLLGSVSHELRNPLAPILMWTTTLRRLRPEDRDVARAADAIEQAIEVARGVLDDLAWIRRLESGRVELERRPIDLARLVAEEADRREVGPRARIRVATTVPPEPVPV
jgi:signal transduction histidine kinase